MKNVFKNLLFVFLIGLFAACQNPSKNDNQLYFSKGWWKFSTLNTSVYLEYDANKNITRAGTFDKEYVPTIVENMNKGETNKWDTYAKNSQLDSRMKFEKVSDANLPEWVNKDNSIKSLLIGTWFVDEEYAGVYNTIDFYNNGSGKYYNINSSEADPFTWIITENNKLKLTYEKMAIDSIWSETRTHETSFEVSLYRLYIANFIEGGNTIFASK